MMMQHHALTRMVCVMMHDFCRENCIPKVIIVIHLFSLSKIIRAKIEGAALRCCNQNNQQYKVQHQERIDRSLDDGLKGLMIIIKVQSSKEKLNVSTKADSKKDQGFDLAVKPRSVIGFKHNPIHLIHKRPSHSRLA
jgi:hypothetical protein